MPTAGTCRNAATWLVTRGNLVAVSSPANSAKGDSTPADRWKPQRGYRCLYAVKYVNVLSTYGLPVPARDKAALTSMLRTCP